MRQIKFRGKDLDTKEWRYGDLEIHRKDSRRLIHSYNDDGGYNRQYDVDEETIGQFTGLKDKNGKEVYEGDIIHVKEYENASDSKWSIEEIKLFDLEELKGEQTKDYISDIVWEDGEFVFGSEVDYKECTLAVLFGDMRLSFPIFDFEVIGNIYDNPELSKK